MSKKKQNREAVVPTYEEFREAIEGMPPEFLKDVISSLVEPGDLPEAAMAEFDYKDPFIWDGNGNPEKFSNLDDETKIETYVELADARARLFEPWKEHQAKERERFEADAKAREGLAQRALVTISGIRLVNKTDWRGSESWLSGKITMDFTPGRAGALSSMLDESLAVKFTDPETTSPIAAAELILHDVQSKFSGGVHRLACSFKMKPGVSEIPGMIGVDGKTVLADISAKQLSFNDFAEPFNPHKLNM